MTNRGPETPTSDRANTWDACLETIEEFYEKGLTDGLPVIPPTRESVDRMMETVDRDPLEVLGNVPPRLGIATIEAVASNAVMAGCLPAYFPVVVAAIEAILEERFNLNGIQATTNPSTPMAIVSGSIVEELNINSGTNVFGHGYRANATIGRAIRLVMTVLGGGYPETGDKSALGQTGKYSYLIGESPANPWEPLHVERGFGEEDSAVTMIGCESPVSFTPGGEGPDGPLWGIAEQIRSATATIRRGGELVLVLNPAVAGPIAERKWTKWDIKEFMYEKARVPLEKMVAENRIAPSTGEGTEYWPRWMEVPDPNGPTMLPVMRKPENLIITVAGGPQAGFCATCPGWGHMGGWSQTKRIRRK
ncbi:hypothetical protein M1O29_03980 [Dehalococcoidia bacterium]|nr:hypothetical protein [Dehalococcoidia bacterium]